MKIKIRHEMSIGLGNGISHAVHHLLLTPPDGASQHVLEWSIDMPGIEQAANFVDAFGNRAHLVSQRRPEGELPIRVAGIVETIDTNGVLGKSEDGPMPALFKRVTPLTKANGSLVNKLRGAGKDGADRIGLLHALMARVGEFYASDRAGPGQSQSQEGQSQSQETAVVRPPAEAGDFAHAFIGAARALDIPARYVTGYLLGSDDAPAAFHAWAEAYDEGLGWIGFDPALGLCPTERHVRLACGLDAASAAPVRSVPALGTPHVLTMRIEAAQ